MENNKLVEYAKRLRSIVDERNKLELDLKNVKSDITLLQNEFVDLMEDYNIQNISLDDIGTIYVHRKTCVNVLDNDVLMRYLKDNGAESLIKETIHHGTLTAHVKECLENKNIIPDGVDVYIKPEVRIRKK